MRVSVVICTWNRCHLLRRTLESFRSLVVPAGQQWELLVVDNRSEDATDQVIAAYRELLPLRRLFEDEIGLSRARNTATRAATGDLVLFTDDDVLIDPDWMKAYLEAAKRWPDAGYFGGRIHPQFAARVPRWVRRNQTALGGMLCLRDVGSVSRRFQPGEFPYGPNMAARREALALARFDERVGRKGHGHVRGSESSLFLSLERRDIQGIWVPNARVDHYIPQCRANFPYLCAYYHGSGRTDVRLGVIYGLHRQPRRRLLTSALAALGAICLRPRDWPAHLATIAGVLGELSEPRRPVARNGNCS